MPAQSFDHYQANGQWVRKPLTTRRVIDRIARPEVRTAHKGEGICLGAEVVATGARSTGYDRAGSSVRGQVWAASGHFGQGSRGYWWIVTTEGYAYSVHQDNMELVGQCSDVALFDASEVA